MLKLPANLLRKTILARLLFSCLIVIVFIIFMGLYFNNWSYKYASQENWAWLFFLASVFAIVIYSYSSYKFVLQPLIDQNYKQKRMIQKAELKQLQSQINPHFLYNSFFTLNSLVKTGDVERIERFTGMLGEYFRFITRNGEDHVWLSEEIKHCRRYAEIQNLRFSRRIQLEFDYLPKEMEQISVPRLIVQPIIENAYEHIFDKMTEDGLLRVSFEMEQNEARVIVEDNGTISDTDIETLKNRLGNTEEPYEMTGMLNIHRRILLTYGDGIGLLVSRSEINGLKVVIRIKLPDMQPVR